MIQWDKFESYPFVLIAGPCVVESEEITLKTAEAIKEANERIGLYVIFKSSIEKANRTSVSSFTGLGNEEALKILEKVKTEFDFPIITDVHEHTDLDMVCDVVDMLQTPAFLCRQTNFIQTVASKGLPVNIKKGQFLAPLDMVNVVEKAKATGNEQIAVCERGVCFGYNNLVSDMRSLVLMKETGCPIIYDATHSVQLPGGQGISSGGQRELIEPLARAAVAVGVNGIFMETHPNPEEALSDGTTSWPTDKLYALLNQLIWIESLRKHKLKNYIVYN